MKGVGKGNHGNHHRTHGLSRTPEYRAWQQMVRRCEVAAHPAFKRYGGRGIRVCARWRRSVAAFVADMGPRPPGHELDRRNNDGHYTPRNCRWVTRQVNDRNRTNNVWVTFRGKRRTVAEWSEVTGVRGDALRWRLRNWTVRRALTTPPRGGR